MAKVVVYTHLGSAAKISIEVADETKVSFAAIGGGDGVPPGMQVKYDDRILCWVAAQDHGVIVVDEGQTTVEPSL